MSKRRHNPSVKIKQEFIDRVDTTKGLAPIFGTTNGKSPQKKGRHEFDAITYDNIHSSPAKGGFGRLGDFAVLVLTAGLYCGDLTVEFLFAVGDTDLLFLLPTLIHGQSLGCHVPLGVGFFVLVGVSGRGGKSSLLMIFLLFFFHHRQSLRR